MNDQPMSVEEKIIRATIGCIEKYGISGATNRQIAQAAGVNLAAINYYFRSKELLIQRVMEITLTNAFDLSDLPSMPGANAQERCIAIMMHLIEGGYTYPGLTRAHFYSLLAEGRYDPLLEKHVHRFIEELSQDLQARGSVLEQDELKLALTQIVSAVIMAILAPALFAQNESLNLQNPDTRLVYVTRLVGKLLE
ncbi:MAG: TetR/AcrR family transcriptional regulator [Chloroflexi bacterium]|nr:MAG: TetR/AcrR family transcriptional regulator [Chloroflexota bacterium]